jgi:hypothetical protein
MAERSLRGSRLGALSMETDDNVVPSERNITTYLCPNGHTIKLPFSVEADVPHTWECRCGAEAKLQGGGPEPEAKPVKHVRTHWDMLLERRSIPELEELLEERLTLLRESRGERPRKRKSAGALPPDAGHPTGCPASAMSGAAWVSRRVAVDDLSLDDVGRVAGGPGRRATGGGPRTR